MEVKILETTIFYNHFCYDCFEHGRMCYYYGTEKDKLRSCPECGSDNVNGAFEDAKH